MDRKQGPGLVLSYFPDITPKQQEQFGKLEDLYSEWNARVNVISRKDISFLYERHVLHSLSIARFIRFTPGTRVLDVGTGGGFPGIPLAIIFPEVQFFLTDSIAKKIKVVEQVSVNLGLKNVIAHRTRSEEFGEKVDFIVCRAVAPFPELIRWSRGKTLAKQVNSIPNGLICLKGGDLSSELNDFRTQVEIVELKDWFREEFFLGKRLIYMPF